MEISSQACMFLIVSKMNGKHDYMKYVICANIIHSSFGLSSRKKFL